MKKQPWTPALPAASQLLNWNHHRWLPHVDLHRGIAVHPFHDRLFELQRCGNKPIQVTNIPEWIDYLSDDISEQMILHVLAYLYTRHRVKTWRHGLCILDATRDELIEGLSFSAEELTRILSCLERKGLVYVGKKGGLAIDWINWRDKFIANGGPEEWITYLNDVAPDVPWDEF